MAKNKKTPTQMATSLPCCPDCGVEAGSKHVGWCDVEQCSVCGKQRLTCLCDHRAARLPWTGEWPGIAECREFGWYAGVLPGSGWGPCSPTDEGAIADINRLIRDAVWDRGKRRWVRKGPPFKEAMSLYTEILASRLRSCTEGT
jgi:hypothetical protein